MVAKVVTIVVTLSTLVSLPEVDILIAKESNGHACAIEGGHQIDMDYALDDLAGHEGDLVVGQLDVDLTTLEWIGDCAVLSDCLICQSASHFNS